jgi:hypothetical protein
MAASRAPREPSAAAASLSLSVSVLLAVPWRAEAAGLRLRRVSWGRKSRCRRGLDGSPAASLVPIQPTRWPTDLPLVLSTVYAVWYLGSVIFLREILARSCGGWDHRVYKLVESYRRRVNLWMMRRQLEGWSFYKKLGFGCRLCLLCCNALLLKPRLF